MPGGGCGGEGNVCVRGEAWPVVAPLAPGCPARRGHPAPGYLAALQLYLGAVASSGRSAALSVGCAPRRRSRLSSRHVRPQGGDVAPQSLSCLFRLSLPSSILIWLSASSLASLSSLLSWYVCFPRAGGPAWACVRACVGSGGGVRGMCGLECLTCRSRRGGGGHTQAGVGGVVVSTPPPHPSLHSCAASYPADPLSLRRCRRRPALKWSGHTVRQ